MRHALKKQSAVKLALVLACASAPSITTTAHAGIPTMDLANITQSIITALENVQQTAQMITSYQTQLQQYQNMLQNTAAPLTNVWDEARLTMSALNVSVNTLNQYRNQLGSIDAYLGRFKDTAAYKNSPCYSPAGCSQAEWLDLSATRDLGNEAQKKATDALFRGLEQQQDNLEADADRLQQIQGAAQGASGQLQAIGYANQLASHQSNQLLQIRGLLIAQQNVIATRNQAVADREAQEAAASASFRSGTYVPSPARTY